MSATVRSADVLVVGSGVAGLSAALGLYWLQRLTDTTRLPEDAATGAILSTFFGAGIVIRLDAPVFVAEQHARMAEAPRIGLVHLLDPMAEPGEAADQAGIEMALHLQHDLAVA